MIDERRLIAKVAGRLVPYLFLCYIVNYLDRFNVAYAALVYGVQQYLVRPYVKGVGGSALYDFYWTSARIDQH